MKIKFSNINNKSVLILSIALFATGWLCPRPGYNELLFLIREPTEFFNYELSDTSSKLFVHNLQVGVWNEIALVEAIENYSLENDNEFIERTKKELIEKKNDVITELLEISREIKKGGNLFVYNYKNGVESGVLVLKCGKISYKAAWYGGKEGSGSHFAGVEKR